METQFQIPKFTDGELEIRVSDDGIAIYGTRDGLLALAKFCMDLASRRLGPAGSEHIHLEDRALLTSKSVHAAVAVFG
jgi:hypothetical protein